MRIACPACSAEYDVPDTIVAAGRKVRCARCHEVWAAAPDGASAAPADAAVALDPAAAATAAPASAPAAAPVLRAEPRRFDTLPGEEEEEDGDDEDAPPASRLWLAAWAASLLILVLGAGAVMHWHAAVIAAWPASVRLFAALGLTGH